LIGEKQKGRVFYRCHYCKGVTVREDQVLSTQTDAWILEDPHQQRLEPVMQFDSPMDFAQNAKSTPKQ
jgi:hypothetical protein